MTLRHSIATIIAFVSGFFFAPVYASGEELPPLVFLADRNYPPMSYMDGDVARGMDVELGRELAERMNRPVRIELMDWSEAQKKVLTGDADGLLGMSMSKERQELYDFSDPLFTREFGLLIKRGEISIFDADDLRGKSVGVTAGGFPRQFIQSQRGVNIVLIENYEEGFQRLSAGEFDAVAADLWVAAYILERSRVGDITVAGKPFASAPAAIAVRKGNEALLHDVNRVIRSMNSDGTVARIRNHWRPQEMIFASRERIREIIARTAGIVFVVLFSAMGAWIITLRRQIRIRKTAESALRESEERYQLAVQGSTDGIWDWNVKTNEVFHSDRLRELLGYTPEEFPNSFHSFESHLHPDDKAWVLKAIEAHLTLRVPYDTEYRLRTKSGTYSWYRARGQAIWDDEGRAIRMAGSITDITRQKQDEKLLKASEERLRAVIEKTPNVAIQFYDREGRVLFWNQASFSMYGWKAEEAVGKTLDQLIHTREEARQFVALLKKIEDTGQPFGPTEFHIHHRDGHDKYCLATIFSIPAEGNGRSFVCMDVDLTELKKADAALRESETRLRTMADATFEGIAICEDGILADVNDQIIRMLGYENRAEMIGIPVVELVAPQSRAMVRDMIDSGRVESYEHLAVRKDGTEFPVEVCGRTISRHPKHVRITAVRDMTARKQAEWALHKSEQEKAEVLRREQTALARYTHQLITSQEVERSRIAGELHDSLGQNLLLLKNRTQMALAEGALSPALREQLSGIRDAAAAAVDEVRRIAHALHPYQLDHLGLTQALESMIENAGSSSSTTFRHKLDSVDDLFPADFAANLYRMVQECLNNIIKHAKATQVDVELERDIREVRLLIRDNGCGFNPESARQEKSDGGMGLKNITQRVRILSGSLKITSAPGAGSSIEAVIPIPGELQVV